MPYLIGFLLALLIGGAARFSGFDKDRAFYPVVLSVIAALYVLFAVMAATPPVLMIEIAVMAGFLAIAAAGFRRTPLWIVAGLAAHGIMDAFHGRVIDNPGVPEWWPAFCATYDLTAAALLAVMMRVSQVRCPAGKSSLHRWMKIAVVTLIVGIAIARASGWIVENHAMLHAAHRHVAPSPRS